jgi:hypothetical protein
MFKKRKWLIVSIAATVIVVAMGVIGGAVYAASGATTPAPATTPINPQTVLADKVATILGLDKTTVEDAFKQAQQEINSERAAAMLKAAEARIDQMVTDGKLTADQAAKYKAWLESKPEVPGFNQNGQNWGFGFNNCPPGGRGGFGRGGMMRPNFSGPPPSNTTDSTN